MDERKKVEVLVAPDGMGPVDQQRREALVRMGKFAGLASPAVVALLTTESSAAWAGSRPVDRPTKPPRPPRVPRPSR
jgi:hypothetical protein